MRYSLSDRILGLVDIGRTVFDIISLGLGDTDLLSGKAARISTLSAESVFVLTSSLCSLYDSCVSRTGFNKFVGYNLLTATFSLAGVITLGTDLDDTTNQPEAGFILFGISILLSRLKDFYFTPGEYGGFSAGNTNNQTAASVGNTQVNISCCPFTTFSPTLHEAKVHPIPLTNTALEMT